VTDKPDVPYLIEQNGWWHYMRRVPLHMQDLDKAHKRFVKAALKIKKEDDPKGRAARKAIEIIDNETQAYWRDLVAGRNADARRRYRLGVKRAQQLGFVYASHQEVANSTQLDQVLRRIEALDRTGWRDPVTQDATLGGTVLASSVLLSELVDQYMRLPSVLLSSKSGGLKGKSEEQIAKFRKHREKAIELLIAQVGDKDILSLSTADANKFTDWYLQYITVNALGTDGPRKHIDVIRKMIRSICERDRLTDPDVWGKNPFPRHEGKRNAFSIAFVKDTMLAPGALDGMAPADRDLLYTLIDTGARLSEICNLRRPFIHVGPKDNIPHIRVRPVGRQLKSKNAIRDVPLIGVALEAMRRNPDGWPQYRDNAAAASKEINRWIKRLLPADADVIESDDENREGTCLYGLRHTFKDRLREVRAEDEMKVALMGQDVGNTGKTPDYGNGYSLEIKAEVMAQIAFARAE
jgi:integrase